MTTAALTLPQRRAAFEASKCVYESATLTFHGVEGFDVYNACIPFSWGGQQYIFGRVEKRHEWARSWVRLFEQTGQDAWTLVPDSMVYQLEDPYIAWIGDELVLGGTHVRYRAGKLDTYYGYFYRGTDLHDLTYFTTGPDYMKDIRLVQLADGRVGVFSRPRSEEIRRRFGSESMIGFTVVDTLDDLTDHAIAAAPYIEGLLGKDEWGGVNQVYLLEDGKLGAIGHMSYHDARANQVYMNIAFIFDPLTRAVDDLQIIGTRPCYPDGPAKKPHLCDCAFTAGIVMRPDGKADLYSGIGDTQVGRVVIDYPFAAHGAIVDPRALALA
jgi:hypothetical protein